MREREGYVLRLPSEIVADELRRLLRVAEGDGVTDEWIEEVKTLLRQAFTGGVPLEDFERVRAPKGWDPIYGDEEPF